MCVWVQPKELRYPVTPYLRVFKVSRYTLLSMLHVAVFLITFSGLVFEIGLTRIYSAPIW